MLFEMSVEELKELIKDMKDDEVLYINAGDDEMYITLGDKVLRDW
jgi:hypothetical protein